MLKVAIVTIGKYCTALLYCISATSLDKPRIVKFSAVSSGLVLAVKPERIVSFLLIALNKFSLSGARWKYLTVRQ
jgi:hypothetical protein